MKEQRNRLFEYAARLTDRKWKLATLSMAVVLILLLGPDRQPGGPLKSRELMLDAGITGLIFLTVLLIQKLSKVNSKDMLVEANPLRQEAGYSGAQFIRVEKMNEEELDHLHAYYKRLSNTED